MNTLFNKLIVLVIILGIFLRFYQFETRTNFTADQGRDYLLVRQLVTDHRLTLLGPKASIGNFFFGPLYYYLLAPALILGNFDPISGTVMTISLDIMALILFAFLAKKLLPSPGVLMATTLYATFPLLINLVKIPLNPFVIPVFSVLFIWCLSLDARRYPLYSSLGLGFVSGLLLQLHFSTAPLFMIGLLWQLKNKTKIYALTAYLTSFALGIAPMILFELRHQFFNSSQIIEYLTHPHLNPNLSEHYFIYFLPMLFLLLAKILSLFPKLVQTLIISGVLVANLYINLKPVSAGYLMPRGWNLTGVRIAAKLIAADQPPAKFEVASILDGDTRALPYRYILESKYNLKPLSVEAYPQAQTLYVITRDQADTIITNPVWEISSIMPGKVTKTWSIQNGVLLHRIDKTE